jgi:hypothetical protein
VCAENLNFQTWTRLDSESRQRSECGIPGYNWPSATSSPCTRRSGTLRTASRQRPQRRWVESVLKPVVERYKGKVSRIYFRADAGFANPEVYEFLDLDQPADRVASRPEIMLHTDLGGVLVLRVGPRPWQQRGPPPP